MKIDQKENISNTMITDFMPSKAQKAWRKKFAKLYGKKKKGAKSSKPKKSKFDKTGKKKDMVAGVDYYKDMRTLLGTAKKPKTKSWKSKK